MALQALWEFVLGYQAQVIREGDTEVFCLFYGDLPPVVDPVQSRCSKAMAVVGHVSGILINSRV